MAFYKVYDKEGDKKPPNDYVPKTRFLVFLSLKFFSNLEKDIIYLWEHFSDHEKSKIPFALVPDSEREEFLYSAYLKIFSNSRKNETIFVKWTFI